MLLPAVGLGGGYLVPRDDAEGRVAPDQQHVGGIFGENEQEEEEEEEELDAARDFAELILVLSCWRRLITVPQALVFARLVRAGVQANNCVI